MIINRKGKRMSSIKNNGVVPSESIYEMKVRLNNGEEISLSSFKGKKIMIVNTASDCGFTPQYADLETLYEKQKERLTIIGFPSNDFGEQERGNDEEIASFCKINFGVSFPLAKKSSVKKTPDQNKIFQWLSDPAKNGWNDQEPVWNFSKYLLDENGLLIDYFGPSISPLSDEVMKAIK
jgi:glutathione peroxidase